MTRLSLASLAALAALGGPAPAPTAAAAPATAAATPVPAPVAALPILGEIDGPTPVVLRGRVSAARLPKLLALARGVYADADRRFLAGGVVSSPPAQVCLFASDADYHAFGRALFGPDGVSSALGFYRRDVRVAVVNLSRGAGNLRHELVHPLLGDDFPEIPAWLNEGIGALYGTARVTGDRARFLVNYRLRDLRDALRAGELPDLPGLVSSTGAEVRGARAPVYYALARYVLLYLDHHGALERFYRDARDGPHDPASLSRLLAAAVDYDDFLAWVDRLP